MTADGFLLDTNVVSELARTRIEPKVAGWISDQSFETLLISVITLGEMEKGFTTMQDPVKRIRLAAWLEQETSGRFAGKVLDITSVIAKRWGKLEGLRQLAGRPLNVPDGLIAATALEHGLTLVTRNVKDFAGIGLNILNPWDLH